VPFKPDSLAALWVPSSKGRGGENRVRKERGRREGIGKGWR